jgi:hypothetical protein|tara:strand:- start:820 stop:1215 length:396 start_codon:yes stop_codon:yes gene_type:complete
MATLTPTLTLASTDASSDAISFSATLGLSVTPPSKGISRINATATGGDNIIVPAGTAVAYLYVKHTGTTDGSTATTQVVDIEDTDNVAFARLGPGEFAFLPYSKAASSKGVQLQVNHASVVQMEYAFFTKA